MLTSSPRADAEGLAGGRATGGGAAASGTITFTTGAGFPALGVTATDAGVDVGALTGAATTVGALEAAVPDLWVVIVVVVAAARVEGAEDAEDAEGGAADTAGDAAKIGALDGDDGGGGGGGGVGRGGAAGGDRTAPNTAGRRGGTGGGMGGGGTAGGRGVASPGRCSGGTGSGCAHAAVGEAKSTNSANAGFRSASTSASRPVIPLPSTSTKYLRGTGEHHPRVGGGGVRRCTYLRSGFRTSGGYVGRHVRAKLRSFSTIRCCKRLLCLFRIEWHGATRYSRRTAVRQPRRCTYSTTARISRRCAAKPALLVGANVPYLQ